MTPQEKEAIQILERGARLYRLVSSEGWDDLMDVMEAQVVSAEFKLINLPAGVRTQVLRDVQSYAKAWRSIFEQTQLRVNSLIEAAQAEAEITKPQDTPQYSNF